MSREYQWRFQMKKLLPVIATIVAMVLAAGAGFSWV